MTGASTDLTTTAVSTPKPTSAPSGGRKGDRTRRRILDAAASVLATAGSRDFSLSDVARVAGLKAGSLYFHFESKDALLGEVLHVGVQESLAHLEQSVDAAGSGSPSRRLAAAIRAHISARSELSDYAAVVLSFDHDHDRDSPDHPAYQRCRRQYTHYWLELIEATQRVGTLSADADPKLIRRLLFGAMNSDLGRQWPPAVAAETLLTLIQR